MLPLKVPYTKLAFPTRVITLVLPSGPGKLPPCDQIILKYKDEMMYLPRVGQTRQLVLMRASSFPKSASLIRPLLPSANRIPSLIKVPPEGNYSEILISGEVIEQTSPFSTSLTAGYSKDITLDFPDLFDSMR